jgi:hypothetical protein
MGIRTVVRNGQMITEQTSDSDTTNGTFSFDTPVLPRGQQAKTNHFTASYDTGVVYTMSGSLILPGITGTLPNPTSMPGSIVTFRTVSKHAHLIEGIVAKSLAMSGAVGNYDRLELGNTNEINHSVVLLSNGNKFMVLAATGSLAVPA